MANSVSGAPGFSMGDMIAFGATVGSIAAFVAILAEASVVASMGPIALLTVATALGGVVGLAAFGVSAAVIGLVAVLEDQVLLGT